MKAENYLTKTGIKIFNALTLYLEGKLIEVDSMRLSELANAMDMVHRASNKINNPDDPKQSDGVQITKNGYTQVTGYVTVVDKYTKIVDSLGAKFGLTPADREKIKAFTKEDEPIDPFEKLRNLK